MSGYIGTQPVPQATQTRDTFTATSGQTSFATSGYTPNYLDVFLNGVKLAAADYTASNGSDVVLAVGATTGDILEVVAYTTFEISGVAGLTPSITDNGNATAITIDSSENVSLTGALDVTGTATAATLQTTAGGTVTTASGNDLNIVYPAGRSLFIKEGSETHVTVDNAGNVGIGVAAPARPLHVLATTQPRFQHTSAPYGMDIGQFDATGNASINNVANAYMSFATNNTERLRISSDGSVLVGKTDTAINTQGVLFSSNFSHMSSTNDVPLALNRKSSDGSILNLRKDGTTVGSIGTAAGTITIDGGGTSSGIYFGENQLVPRDNGAGSNNVVDIGQSGNSFKDLYLSGGVYLGGTGAANKLSDYEEGTWTPTLPNGGTVGTIVKAVYIKVGNLVNAYCNVYINPTNNSTQFKIGGLPFASTGDNHGGGTLSYVGGMEVRYWSAPLVNSSSEVYFHRHDASTGVVLNNAFGGANRQFIMQLTYSLN